MIAIVEGLEDVQEFRQDTTVIETSIHYPAHNPDFSPRLVWDCSKRFLSRTSLLSLIQDQSVIGYSALDSWLCAAPFKAGFIICKHANRYQHWFFCKTAVNFLKD